MRVTIPGALADHLAAADLTTGPAAADPAARDARATLDAGRRGRGRTLIITPHSTAALRFISAFAEAILINRNLHTAAEARAARTWLDRAGRATTTLAADLAAKLVTEAEATDGTWRGEWIGERSTTPTLFPLDREQGALFA
ncbi:hypothetical protein H9Y04_15970 [Streptomyces sp. TRM66268-LWL]|uniref:Uncharacterized protein n=1 Tax=Streptomyces polyasparticus TaxID=2767826 RepID=A0ABR7SGE7_9ACTN|nr:hypothetical protein [Streptomyces polyasparticus]MBC9714062.1 hypothetical protein [Streptomyces polyasparticus]